MRHLGWIVLVVVSLLAIAPPGARRERVALVIGNSATAPQAVHFIVFDACRSKLGGIRGSKGFVPVAEKPGMLIAFSSPIRQVWTVASAET